MGTPPMDAFEYPTDLIEALVDTTLAATEGDTAAKMADAILDLFKPHPMSEILTALGMVVGTLVKYSEETPSSVLLPFVIITIGERCAGGDDDE
jgi:hypothetical protein